MTPRLVTQRFNALKEQNKVVSPTIAEDPANFALICQPTAKVLPIVEKAAGPRALDKTVSFLARAIRRKDRGDSTLRVEFQRYFGTFCAKAKADRIRHW